MKHRNTHAIMLPTNDPLRGRWVHYRYRNLYPGDGRDSQTGPQLICHTDELARREASIQGGYRPRTAELKRAIRRRLGVKALDIGRIAA